MREISEKAIQEASAWLVEFESGDFQQEQRRQWEEWYEHSEENKIAWRHIENLKATFVGVPANMVLTSVDEAEKKAQQRRILLKTLACLAVLSPLGYRGFQETLWYADYRTRVGEIKETLLSDGSFLALNTNTAVDVQFNKHSRLIYLKSGEILVQTDPNIKDPRPLVVITEHGEVKALGTRFTVYLKSEVTQVNVLEHAVEIQSRGQIGENARVEAGMQIELNAEHSQVKSSIKHVNSAWVRHTLIVDNWSLGEFIDEVGRYRSGVLRVTEGAAKLRISGSFPLRDTNKILTSLSEILPVNVRYLTRYWVSVELQPPEE